MKIAIASDHAGFCLKEDIMLSHKDIDWIDFGVFDKNSADYPDTGRPAALAVVTGKCEKGILICGSGIGMSIVANRIIGIRAALCWNPEIAELSRKHNDANVLVLPGKFTPLADALQIIEVWLSTLFEGGRHQRRIEKIDQP